MSLPSIPTTWPNLFRSIQGPLDGIDCEIVGTIPEDLAGNFLAMGPSLFDVAGRPVESWFDGQGGMHRFQIDGGSNSAKAWSKVVESNDYRDEQDAGVQTINHFAINTPQEKPGQGVRTANTSNTQAFVWRNELFALYEGGWPVQVDPSDLSTPDDADTDLGILDSSEKLSAHWHRHPSREADYNYGLRSAGAVDMLEVLTAIGHVIEGGTVFDWMALGKEALDLLTQIKLYKFPHEGAKAEEIATVYRTEYPFLHDFILTENYAVFLIPPVSIDVQRQLNWEGTLADNYGWHPDQGTEVVLIALDSPHEQWRFRVPAFWLWHFANAYEDGAGNLVVDYNQYDDYRRDVKSFLLSVHSGRYPASVGPSKFVRATIDLEAAAAWVKSPASKIEEAGEDVYAVETLWDVSTEFARIAPSVETRDYQFAYMAAHSSPYAARRCLWDELAKVDVKAKTVETLSLGDERTPSEPIFVPRANSTAEDDGYILCLTYDGDHDKSFVAILDAQKLSEGTIAEIWLPQHVPVTFHRIWVTPEDWPTGARPPGPPGPPGPPRP